MKIDELSIKYLKEPTDADKKRKIYCKDCVHFWEHSGECHINPLYARPTLDYSSCPAAERNQ